MTSARVSALQPLRKIGKGNQYVIFANSQSAYKVKRPLARLFGGLTFNVPDPNVNYRAAEALGEMILPHLFIPEMECKVVYPGGTKISRTFRDVVAQELIPGKDLLQNWIKPMYLANDMTGLRRMFLSIADLSRRVIEAGMFIPDPIPGNFCVKDGRLKLLDSGMIQTDLSRVLKAVEKGGSYSGYLENLGLMFGLYFHNVKMTHELPQKQFERALSALREYQAALQRISEPEVLKALWGEGGSGRHCH